MCSYWNGNGGCIANKTKLNLMDIVYEHDQTPLMEGCSCYACKKFT